MGLFARFLPGAANAIGVHSFMGAIAEFQRGMVTGQQVIDAFGLSSLEVDEALALLARIQPDIECHSLGGFVQLTNVGTSYDANNQSTGLGIIVLPTAGITRAELAVHVNKVGTGTQSWQLWNETSQSEVMVVDDSGATGRKLLTVARDFAPALGVGTVVVRLRAKSTVASDDPVFLGASLRVFRVARLTAVELHEILLMANAGNIYTTEESLRARLGLA